jgi:hypothetical protein
MISQRVQSGKHDHHTLDLLSCPLMMACSSNHLDRQHYLVELRSTSFDTQTYTNATDPKQYSTSVALLRTADTFNASHPLTNTGFLGRFFLTIGYELSRHRCPTATCIFSRLREVLTRVPSLLQSSQPLRTLIISSPRASHYL